MSQEISGEESARLDLVILEPRSELTARKGRGFAHREYEAEGRRFGPRGFGGQDEELLIALHVVAHGAPVLASRHDEARQLLELLASDRRLEVERLEVVADMGVGVLVVEPERQGAELIAKALAAGVVLAWFAPAVAAPVAEGAGDPVHLSARGEHRATLARRHLVSRIEGEGRKIAERSHGLSIDPRTERVAAVLHQEHPPLAAQRSDRRRVVGEAHRVGEDHGTCALRDRVTDG